MLSFDQLHQLSTAACTVSRFIFFAGIHSDFTILQYYHDLRQIRRIKGITQENQPRGQIISKNL